MTKIYIVEETTGVYSDQQTCAIAAFQTKAQAET